MKIEGLPPLEYIHDKKFKSTLNENYKEQIVKLFEDNIEIVVTSLKELTPLNLRLSFHKNRPKLDDRPIKQRFYGLSKLKSDIFKKKN